MQFTPYLLSFLDLIITIILYKAIKQVMDYFLDFTDADAGINYLICSKLLDKESNLNRQLWREVRW